MSHAYRSVYEHMVGAKLAEREAAYAAALPWLGRLARLQRARIARAVAGAVGISGASALALTSVLSSGGEPTTVLLASVGGMIVSWLVTRLVLGVIAASREVGAFAPPALTGDLKTDLTLLEAKDPLRALLRRLEQSEGFGTDLLAIAICLLAPLTLHFLFILAMNGYDARGFAWWIRISLLIVGHGHLALAVLTARYTKRLRTNPDEATRSFHREWGKAFGWTIAVTCLPGILLFAVPPILSAVTAIAFVPFLFLYVQGRHQADRALIAFATATQTPADAARIGEIHDAHEPLAEPMDGFSVASGGDRLASRS